MPTFAPGASSAPGSGSESGTDADADAVDGLDGSLGVAGPRKRRGGRLSADQRRAQLLDAAVVEFAERGYQGTRTADIAARAGVSQPYVYALFPDKRSLFLACHAATTDRIRESIEKASAGSGSAASSGLSTAPTWSCSTRTRTRSCSRSRRTPPRPPTR